CGAATTTLAPLGTVGCTATYSITQADLDAGHVTNAATAHGAGQRSEERRVGKEGSPTRSIHRDKTDTPDTNSTDGQTNTHHNTNTNTGIFSLGPDQLSVIDACIGFPRVLSFYCGAATTTLAPLGTVGCTATYSITQADLDAGHVTNAATAHGAGQ